MRIYRAIMPVQALLILAGCGTGDNEESAAKTLIPDESGSGEVTSDSAYNVKDGSRSELFDVALEAGQVVSFELSGALEGTLSLHDPDGEFLKTNADPWRDEDAAVSLSLQAETDGTYLLAVSGRDHRSYGPFGVAARLLDVREGGALALDEEVAGLLNDRADTYAFEAPEAGLYEFTMRSGELDASLILRGEGLKLEDDDSGGGLDARLGAYLAPGSYEIDAGWTGETGQGLYTLDAVAKALPGDGALQQGGPVVSGESVNGWMSGTPLDYELVLEERSMVEIDMMSDDFDTYLDLSGEGLALSDDDGGDNLNARIRIPLGPGTYEIRASHAGSGQGLFALSVSAESYDQTTLPVVAIGHTVEARLNGEQDEYNLAIDEAGHYTLDMTSDNLDTYLELHGHGVSVQDDDGGENANARLSLRLEPGDDYLVVARTYDGGQAHGEYQLSVRRD